MSTREEQFLKCYQKDRFTDQRVWYLKRIAEFQAARNQAIILTSILIGCAGIASVLAAANVLGWREWWVLLAVFFPASATAFAAYDRLYAFEQQAKLYQDAARALLRVQKLQPRWREGVTQEDYREMINLYVLETEAVFHREQGQWGQLINQVRPAEPPGGEAAQKPSASRE